MREKLAPYAAAAAGIALFTLMDAVMKGLALEIGAYRAMLWRTLLGVGPALALLAWTGRVRWPERDLLLIHLKRGGVNALSAVGYFYGLTRLPMAEGIALSFISPLVALYLAAALLGERVGLRAVLGSLLGFGGVLLLLALRAAGRFEAGALGGAIAILAAAAIYGYGLILLRRQAQRATAAEIGLFQTGATLLWLLPLAPWFAPPPPARLLPPLLGGAALAQGSIMLLAWAYARSEARRLIPIEYSGFLWAVLFGALMFGEALAPATLLGAVLIVAGCLLAASARAPLLETGELGQ